MLKKKKKINQIDMTLKMIVKNHSKEHNFQIISTPQLLKPFNNDTQPNELKTKRRKEKTHTQEEQKDNFSHVRANSSAPLNSRT